LEFLRHKLEVERADDWEELNFDLEKLNKGVVEVVEGGLGFRKGGGEGEGEGEERWPWICQGEFPGAKAKIGLVGDRVRLISDILSVREEDGAKSLQDQLKVNEALRDNVKNLEKKLLAEKNRADIEISTLKVQITEINEQNDIYLTRIEDFNRDIEPKNFRLNDLEELLKVTKTKLQSSQQKEVSLFKANNQLEIKNSELKRLNDDNIERKNLELEKRKTDLAFITELESLLEQAKELRLETELKYGKSEN
jgi:hypothetical protein